MPTNIPIFFSVNDQYAASLAVAMQSLINHAASTNHYQLMVLYQELSADNQEQLGQLATENVSISFIPLEERFSERFDNDQNKLRADYVTLTIYYRLFIADMFPEFDKAIYLDADILVRDDIAKLYDIDLLGALVGAANDRFIATDPTVSAYAAQVVGINPHLYVNSGILLMDLKKFRDTHFTDTFLQLLTTYHFTLIAPDQDYINALAKDDLYQLPMEWNLETAVMPANFHPARLVHYNLFEKPWQYRDVPFADEFWRTAKQTSYYDVLESQLRGTTDADHQQNDQKIARLMATAVQLTNDTTQPTLRTVLAEQNANA
ncbi:glycosyltransferase family 8 protein [Lacticaseibacillus brantae]|uniref:Glycosyl transferase family protein n=1 Tax=Lacticaseibacillus brantae DSM 23927 TaxID=1423727 RepID=A0A0R2AZA4_9LACO|nr:glycosyltransferase family 8 protein [Lacticaseibacillus brantae]KRM72117.1 glycosyl transferase family protein [Lacticaseibacillus brantae DSM 23927]